MSRPDTRVYIAFDLAAGGSGDFFTLSDPVKGVLDNTDFKLAGDILEDVTEDVRGISVRRGRSRQLEQFQAGAATVDLRNDERKYDPSAGTAITPYGASMRPRKRIVIEANGQRVFTGVVDDWDLLYSLDNDHIASVDAVGGFVQLAGQTLDEHTFSEESTGERIASVLDRPEVSWTSGTDFATGNATLQGDTVASDRPVNVLSYLQRVELAEPGALFVDAGGVLTFRSREDLQNATDVVFADSAAGISFSGIEIAYGAEELKNRAFIARQGAGTATAVNQASIDLYGPIDYSITDSLLSSDEQAEELATWLVNLYAEPQLRIDKLEIDLGKISVTDVNRVLGLELGDVIQVLYTPSGIGDEIDRFAAVDAITHSVDAGRHIVTLDVSQTIAGFVLDSPALGVLDSSNLGF